jgi:hypothetical protein
MRREAEGVEASEARAFAPRVNVARAALARVVGDEAGWQRELREAHRLFAGIRATARAERVAKGAGFGVILLLTSSGEGAGGGGRGRSAGRSSRSAPA